MDFKKDEYWSEHFKQLELSGREISSKEFEGCTFDSCDFSESTFKACTFTDCEFIGCNLSIVKLKYSTLSNVCFRDSKLVGINWTTVSWSSLLLDAPIKFYNSILNDSSFQGLSLKELVLDECKAHHVDFRDGDFTNASFTRTDLAGGFFNNTNLTGADFSTATNYNINIHQNMLTQAKFNRFEAVRLLESLDIELVD